MERVASDTPAVVSHRVDVERRGGPGRACVRLPAGTDVGGGAVVRVTVGDHDGYARVERDDAGALVTGVFDNRRLAREPADGENRLSAWLDAVDRGPGSTVVLDVLAPGEHYGLREPGDRVVYAVPARRDDSLASIAEQVEDDAT